MIKFSTSILDFVKTWADKAELTLLKLCFQPCFNLGRRWLKYMCMHLWKLVMIIMFS